MLMLDGMPAVRVKAEPLESERGVREQLFFYTVIVLNLLSILLYHLPLLLPLTPPPSRCDTPNYSQTCVCVCVCVCVEQP